MAILDFSKAVHVQFLSRKLVFTIIQIALESSVHRFQFLSFLTEIISQLFIFFSQNSLCLYRYSCGVDSAII